MRALRKNEISAKVLRLANEIEQWITYCKGDVLRSMLRQYPLHVDKAIGSDTPLDGTAKAPFTDIKDRNKNLLNREMEGWEVLQDPIFDIPFAKEKKKEKSNLHGIQADIKKDQSLYKDPNNPEDDSGAKPRDLNGVDNKLLEKTEIHYALPLCNASDQISEVYIKNIDLNC